NPEADKIIEKIRTEYNVAERNKLYEKFQEVLYNDQPVVFLFAPKEPVIISKKFPDAKPTIIKPGFTLNYFH
ncbi:MAG TPA: hypothetical protein PKZ72_03290, partial [Saprospiraceae bacterium]|nr:hypothetical protein [Saprospiraceae bacterium]